MLEPGTLGRRLREARTRKRMTGAQLGKRLGLAPSQISKMETGRQKVPAELLPAWCEAVSITLPEVYGAENLHHFAQIPFPPLTARLYAQLPKEWQLHIQRSIESTYQAQKKAHGPIEEN
ncbi:helix-turn-helix transcriptional regulator [uncultured Microbulbifer sp.]|uniref:helix-turn-helix domain-containing protein n=1 Tax=uncultured Microbulbifer sp. TaxID=348147 RepID=UPI00261528FA|nr:helix-turn-helix transcriptional regulator [uncultured Microbulbifer sp.]